jgi:hypothetical protein
MLIKLMKHEFRATGRVMLPLYAVLMLTAVGANLSSRGLLETKHWFFNVIGALLVLAFVLAIAGVCVMSVVLMIRRFYLNLLRDEGYVMMTLPVSVHQQVWSKLIVSAVWFAATFAAIFVAMGLMVYDVGFVKLFFDALGDFFRGFSAYYAVNLAAMTGEFLLLMFVGCCVICLQFYAALAVGHSFSGHKMLLSVGFFFLFLFGGQILSTAALQLLSNLIPQGLFMVPENISYVSGIHLGFWVLIVGEILYGAIFYVLTTWFLKKHLNLE